VNFLDTAGLLRTRCGASGSSPTLAPLPRGYRDRDKVASQSPGQGLFFKVDGRREPLRTLLRDACDEALCPRLGPRADPLYQFHRA